MMYTIIDHCACILSMAIRVVEFSNGGTKLERFLPIIHAVKIYNFFRYYQVHQYA